ncbi:hypothetical protein KCM76_13640 [Zooshikella marina]|uniref:Uncharacterized protein n=1 Tax=Zooshikella ganghwensis TaxID=202772 RepID=A0A4P9VL38_9GAMM|nr:hypothetical protein [Zooshikella ganghwensis]MBU2707032.1 hypothetical protein [Zooshikella ganghwensis]RDH43496.1 hypothetical protein B9G39_08610 [Zooshikella ganghwensis]
MAVQAHSTEVVLSPTKVTATEFELVLALQHGNPVLTITAEGYAEGITGAHVVAVDLNSKIPVFKVVAHTTTAIGYFPYTAKNSFEGVNPDLQEIAIQTSVGITKYKVTHLLSNNETQAVPASVKALNENQVVGYAYNQSNLDLAFSNAVNQLYTKFAGHISAKVVDSGFIAAGSPVGIAYTYVVVEQQQ